jgi:crossover junction endodeoxyribonuclease RuvC
VFVLGIDPGLSRCGYGCLDGRSGRAPRPVAVGIITTPVAAPTADRLADLQLELRELIAELRPDVVAVERVLFSANARTAMSVAQAAGLALAESVNAGCQVVEYSPNEVKQAVAGWGGARKSEIERMVQTLINLDRPLRPADAADAVALALCHLARAPQLRAVARAEAGQRAGNDGDDGAGIDGVGSEDLDDRDDNALWAVR